MNRETYRRLEGYMLSCMEDSAHDKEHIYRVLYNALTIAAEEPAADTDVLVCACLLHDVGRAAQFADPSVCHARAGGEKAYRFLTENGFAEEFARHVQACITTHRFRRETPPESIEAKILFDADKLDVTGALGVARTLLYQGEVGDPLYTLRPDGGVSDGTEDARPSFFREYKFKLEKLYDCFYTQKGGTLGKGAAGCCRRVLQRAAAGSDLCACGGFGAAGKCFGKDLKKDTEEAGNTAQNGGSPGFCYAVICCAVKRFDRYEKISPARSQTDAPARPRRNPVSACCFPA